MTPSLLATLMPEPSTIVRPGPALPVPRADVAIRPGTLADVPFMDALQKLHTKQVGWMPTKQFEGKIALGHVLVAEEAGGGQRAAGGEENTSHVAPAAGCLPPAPIGYCIGNDQYFKRDDVGIIYQMNVVPGKQRAFVGAALLRAMFERSAYGCKLFCCWCAQDIAANRFWEAMGFVPLAFRAGSRTKGKDANGKTAPRVHIFWQKRIRDGDTTTPWWFPSQTGGGSIREDRIVLPIPPGTHWSDAKPMILPGTGVGSGRVAGVREEKKALADSSASTVLPTAHCPLPTPSEPPKRRAKAASPLPAAVPVKPVAFDSLSTRGLRFAPAPTAKAIETVVPTPVAQRQTSETVEPPPGREPRKKPKNDPRLVSAARELRDRWLDQIDTTPLVSVGKYDVTRTVAETIAIEATPAKRLAA